MKTEQKISKIQSELKLKGRLDVRLTRVYNVGNFRINDAKYMLVYRDLEKRNADYLKLEKESLSILIKDKQGKEVSAIKGKGLIFSKSTVCQLDGSKPEYWIEIKNQSALRNPFLKILANKNQKTKEVREVESPRQRMAQILDEILA